ncbi:hypothetical protein GCM10027217_02660 [Pseudomaricurvus hydrocarbonicus]
MDHTGWRRPVGESALTFSLQRARRAVFALLAFGLTACSWITPARPPELPLLSPATFGQQWQVTQSVTLQPLARDDRAPHRSGQTLLAAWSVSPARLDFAGLTPTGQTLLTLSYDGQQLTGTTSPLLPKEVSGRDILAQLQLAYWPLHSIQQALSGSPWSLRQVNPGRRELWLNGQLTLDLQISPTGPSGQPLESIIITHPLRGYQLKIQTISRETLSAHPSAGQTSTPHIPAKQTRAIPSPASPPHKTGVAD